MTHQALLLSAIRDPASIVSLDAESLYTVLRLARRLSLLARLADALQAADLLEELPARAQPHLRSALVEVEASRRSIRWEMDRIASALRGQDFHPVLLKGAAYEMAGLPPASARVSTDVDLLVRIADLASVEQSLLQAGWHVADLSHRHERYFRAWLHELPPLKHRDRETLLDVHHGILPKTDSLRVNAEQLLARSMPTGVASFRTLSSEDMVIHCAIHLFRNGNFANGLRDLHDLDLLIRHFSTEQADFGDTLAERVREFGLMSPCFFAFRAVGELFETPLPQPVRGALDQWQPAWAQRRLMQGLLKRALVPRRLDAPDRSCQAAIDVLAYWPLPRIGVMFSPLFWAKRFQNMHTGQ